MSHCLSPETNSPLNKTWGTVILDDRVGCGVVRALVRSAAIVEVEISADRGAGLADVVVGPQVDLLVFDAAP